MDFLKRFWEGWKRFGRFLGNLLARVVLTIFYFTIFLPFGIGVTLLSDPLAIKSIPQKLWRPKDVGGHNLEDMLRQF